MMQAKLRVLHLKEEQLRVSVKGRNNSKVHSRTHSELIQTASKPLQESRKLKRIRYYNLDDALHIQQASQRQMQQRREESAKRLAELRQIVKSRSSSRSSELRPMR